jgi:hypothetical protein
MLGLIVCSVACGNLEKINLGEKEAYELLGTFLKQTSSGQDDGSLRIDGFIARTQDALMAYRKEDFLFIQSEPPFRPYARSNLQEFAGLWREHRTEEVRRRYSAIVRNRGQERPTYEPIRILSGKGESPVDPIKFSTDKLEERIRAENWYMNYLFGPRETFWNEILHKTTTDPGGTRLLSAWDVELRDGSRKSIYFDTGRY